MQYALLIYAASAPETLPEPSPDAAPDEHGVFPSWVDYTRGLKHADALLAVVRLQPVETATSVRMREGERLLTDGPFMETKENLLGLYLIEAPSLDIALDWAARMPFSRAATVEVRPVMPAPALTQIVAE